LVGLYVGVLFVLMGTTSYDIWGGLLVAPVLVAITVPALRRQARLDGDPRLARIVYWGFAVKLLGAVARYGLAFVLYDNRGDAFKYHQDAILFGEQWARGHFDLAAAFQTQESFISFITALGQVVMRPSIMGGFLLFSWLAFWGLFWFYRAFRLAVPEGRARTYAKLIFFVPSVVFWPSSIGKEAWMLFALGLAALGVAHLLTGKHAKGIVLVGLGLLGATVVRPHVAAIVALALVCAYLVKRPAPSLGQLAPVAKLITVAAMALVALFFLQRTADFLTQSGLPVQGGLGSVNGVRGALGEATLRTEQGGSEFQIPALTPVGILPALGTVLFRPFPFEAPNAQAFAAALESLWILGLLIVRYRWVAAAVRSIRRQPYVAYLVAFLIGGALVLTSVANFGILARQRTLLIPALMILVSIPPARSGDRRVTRASEIEVTAGSR
jgi:hypothetical protein